MVTVVARIRAKEGMEEQMMKELMALVEPSRADAGCVNYDLHRATDDKGLFLFHENWSSREDLEAHIAKPHLKAFLEKAEAMTAGAVEISIWEMVSAPAR